MKSTASRSRMVDRAAALPLYHQIYLQLRDEILSGERGYGTLVAKETQLSRDYSVSRMTARRALDELAHHRLVTRKRRVGTTVIFRTSAKPIEASVEQEVDSLRGSGRATGVKVLYVGKEIVTPAIAEALQIRPGCHVVHAVRVWYLDGEPFGYMVSYALDELSHAVTRTALGKRPILAAIRRAGYRLGKSTQNIAAILADSAMSSTLKVEPRAAILRVSRIVYDHEGKPLLVTQAHYGADRYQLRIDLHA